MLHKTQFQFWTKTAVFFMFLSMIWVPGLLGQISCEISVTGPDDVCLNSTQTYTVRVESSSSSQQNGNLVVMISVEGGTLNGSGMFFQEHTGFGQAVNYSGTITWTDGNGGSVEVSVVGASQCTESYDVSIMGDQPDFTVSFACQNSAKALQLSSGQNSSSINWSTDNGSIVGQNGSAVLTPSSVGTANVTVSSVDICGQTRTNTIPVEVRDDQMTAGHQSSIQGQWIYESYGNTGTVNIWNPDPKATYYEWWGLVPVSEYTTPNAVAVVNPRLAPGNYYMYTHAGNGCAFGPTMSMRVYIYTNNWGFPSAMIIEDDELSAGANPIDMDEQSELALQVYPNPTNEHTDIKVPSSMGNVSQVILQNKAGDRVMEYQNVGSELGINTSNLEEGIYFIKILLDSGKQINKRLVVDHP